MRARILLLISIFLLLVGCTTQEQQSIILPTLVPSATPDSYGWEGAQRVATTFLEAWRNADYVTMHGLTTVATQDAIPFDEFQTIYEDAQGEMTMLSFSYRENTLFRESPTVFVLNYDITFATNILGDFSDTNRNMHLVIDERVGDWRIAWSPGDIFAEMGDGGVLRLERNIPNRLNIYDRNGGALADQNGRVVVVQVVRSQIPSLDACLNELATALDLTTDEVQTRLNNAGVDWLADVGVIEANTYMTLHADLERDCAAQFAPRSVRRYPNGALAPHIVGYVGYPDDAEIPAVQEAGFPRDAILGRSGIELSWDETLRGSPGGRLTILSRTGERLRLLAEAPPQPSQSVWLTIDPGLQAFVNQAIADAYATEAWGTRSPGAAAVIMDVHTGAILAMVSYPTFDVNYFTPFPENGREAAQAYIQSIQDDPRLPLLNRATQGIYPAGSTFKIIDTIAVTDSNVYPMDQSYNCSGVWERDGIVRYDWLEGGHGHLTLPQPLTQSCNPFYYEVGYQMNLVDPFLLPEYARRLGLGSLTGLTDIAESPGLIGDPDWLLNTRGEEWNFTEAISMAIGQGAVQVTPLQMARIVALVANGGDLVRPQLVQQAGIFGETPGYIMQPEITSTPGIRSDVIDLVREGMCAVTTTQAGTAYFVFRTSPLQDIGVCGKTGTAQDLTSPDALPFGWFVAYAPREDPEIAIAVVIEDAGEGSEVAAPIVRRILEYYFLGITSTQ
ncbi:MAG: penicillin-binding transpeptidase domain-containing protein [Anaerolineae bacterium]